MSSQLPSIARLIEEAIKTKSEQIKTQIVEEAVEQFETEVRKAVGQVSLNLFNLYSIERLGQELVIKVRIDHD